GENLVIYCFAEEHHDIEELRASETLSKAAASRAILGVSYADLGAAVAATWGLPGLIIDAIRGLPPGPVRASPDEDAHLRNLCVFANELCGLFPGRSPSSVTHQLTELLGKFEPVIALEASYATKLINAAFEKLKAYAPIFEISIAQSQYCTAINRWIDASAKQ
ncbi:MAG: HDOD domain-containing protein, partial [Algiphilus sp.]